MMCVVKWVQCVSTKILCTAVLYHGVDVEGARRVIVLCMLPRGSVVQVLSPGYPLHLSTSTQGMKRLFPVTRTARIQC